MKDKYPPEQPSRFPVYYEKYINRNFLFNLKQATRMAESCNVTLAIEIMDNPYINNLFKFRNIFQPIDSNHLFAYPDVGNIGNIFENLCYGKKDIIAIYLKDSLKVLLVSFVI